MTDIVLFRIRNRPIVTLASLYTTVLLFSFTLFMIGGNFFRLFPLPPFPSHLSIIEVLLYGLAFPIYFSRLRKSHLLILGIVLSTAYGTLLHGWNVASALYSFKLIAMIAAGCAVGEALSRKFSSVDQCLSYFVKLFLAILFLGSVIFVFFPKAQHFFQFLQGYGVQFIGDPHQKRFISPFFDPNYYSAIACMPLLLAWLLSSKHVFYRVSFFLFLASIFLSFSRSGIATCTLLLLLMGTTKISIRALFIALGIGALTICYSEEAFYFFSRFIHLNDDPSAHARWVTFQAGLEYFWEHPFFGVGYNYLSHLLEEEMGILSPDSSLLVTLANFGLIPCLIVLLSGVYWSINRLRKSRPFSWLCIYSMICILFTSQFNNLLYYQYWLIPMIALFTYFEVANENRTCP